ncbi:hypothetical protein ACQJBY_036274 [Aegilops geniculata]
MAGVLNDLVVAVQGIRLFLASPYGPPQPPPLPAPSASPALPWYSVPAALAGGYPALQQPAASAPAWPQWPAPAPAASAASAPTPWPVWPAPTSSAPAAPAPLPSPTPSAGLSQGPSGGLPIQQALPWYSVPAAITGGYSAFPPPAALTPPWPQWPTPYAAPTAPPASTQRPQWPTWAPPPAPSPTAPSLPAATGQVPPPPPPNPSLGRSSPSGLPIQEVRFPSSPSPIPAWLTGTSPPPVYTEAGDPSVPPLQFGASSGSMGSNGGLPTMDRAPSSALRITEPVGPGASTQTPPRFAKIDFATYDGSDDPLNWLNQCDQFFRGQRTPASERTWLASYHLRGAAQTWYYALEQDEGGMPPWERFRELCLLRFGPPMRGSRLAELGRLPFASSVQDFADRFQALACHAPGVTALQRAEILERRRQGLCFNCDEPYTPGHACPRLFYLEVADYIPEDAVAADLAAPAVEKVFDAG